MHIDICGGSQNQTPPIIILQIFLKLLLFMWKSTTVLEGPESGQEEDRSQENSLHYILPDIATST
jgi:hypothetical protein